uniref:MIT domain-containing protein n=1 Tax=Glossina brevipalpis TaxID=37001 RepID=A0A1A9WFL4_9MUSC
MNAKEILMKAVICDQSGRILQALAHYQDGINILMDLVNEETNADKKKVYHARIKEYLDRAEQIKERISRLGQSGSLLHSVSIEDGATGYSFHTLFGKYLSNDVKEVLIEEPYLAERYQFQNLVNFFEVIVKHCTDLKFIRLVTKTDSKNPENQMTTLDNIKTDLSLREITLHFTFEPTLHDRKILLGSGYVIKIGRGLHFYKPNNPRHTLGICDYDFRKCLQTDVDILRVKKFS